VANDLPAGRAAGEVAAHLIRVGVEPLWTIRVEGEPAIGLEAATPEGAEALVSVIARRFGQSGWVEDEPGQWRRVGNSL
jgi:hypothetical protein